jgi:hypothetical protein
MLMLVAKTVD